jgi:hypothetical protein
VTTLKQINPEGHGSLDGATCPIAGLAHAHGRTDTVQITERAHGASGKHPRVEPGAGGVRASGHLGDVDSGIELM